MKIKCSEEDEILLEKKEEEKEKVFIWIDIKFLLIYFFITKIP